MEIKQIKLLCVFIIFNIFVCRCQCLIDTIKLEKYLKRSLKTWRNPGLILAVINDTSIIYSKGFGYIDIEKSKKVDQKTIFFTASLTKAFTVSALSILIDQNKLNWDTRVTQIIQDFEVENNIYTDSILLKDLLSHRIGYKTFSGDLIWYGTKYNREEVIQRIKYVPFSYPFRQKFGYSNLMYLVAGEIIPKLTDKSWENYIRENLFYPLEMQNSYLTLQEINNIENVAKPYILTLQNKKVQVEYIDWSNIAPAGSIFSNIEDLSKWVIMWLNYGKYYGIEILDSCLVQQMITLKFPIPVSINEQYLWPTLKNKGYGYGWYTYQYHDNKIVEHNGGALGMVSQITLVPGKKLGFVILTNSNNYLPIAIHYYLLDMILDKNINDWSWILYESYKNYNLSIKDEIAFKIDSLKQLNNKSNPVVDIYGRYSCEMYGDIEIFERNDSILCNFVLSNIHTGLLEIVNHNYYTIEILNDPSLTKGIAKFITDSDQTVIRLEIYVPNPDFDFRELKFIKIK